MTQQLYDIYYLDGLQTGVTPCEAAQNLMKLVQISEQQAQLLIASTNRVVKRGLPRNHAERYLSALQRVGMQVEIRHQSGSTPSAIKTPPGIRLDDEVVAAVKRKQQSEYTHNYDRTLK